MTLAPERPGQRQVRGVPAPEPAAAAPTGREVPPKLAEGVHLTGEFEGSGFKEPHYLARRGDGQVVQLSRLLYLVAKEADGTRSPEEIAERVAAEFGRPVSADNVRYLAEKKLRPLGVLTTADGAEPDVRPLDPLLALRFRTKVVPERAVRAVTALFWPLFLPPVVVAALGAFVTLDVWLFFVHGVGAGLRETLYEPFTFLLVLGLVVVSAAFHEVGHATACRYGGAKPGVMGAGIYVAWPAFYTDVTDAYRLGRGGRLRTDLGGVYFNVVFALGVAAVYFATGYEPLLLLVVIQQLEIVHQMLPFLRLDGYYVVSDLTGVPDLFLRMKPILRSMLPGRKPDRKVTELKPWVRVFVTVWVLLVVPILLFNLTLVALMLPKMIVTAWDSLGQQRATLGAAFGDGAWVDAAAGLVQCLLLVLPIVGLVYTFARLGTRVLTGAWGWSGGSLRRRALVSTTALSVLAALAYACWPSADYRPLEEGERGTLTEVASVTVLPPAERPDDPPAYVGSGSDADDPAGTTDGTTGDGGTSTGDGTVVPSTAPSTDAADPVVSPTTDTGTDATPSPEPTFSAEPTASPS